MNTFKSIADVIDNAIALHHRAAAMYRNLAMRSLEHRTRLLLEYMAEHERQMEQSVADAKKGTDNAILNTYIQFTLEEHPKRVLERLLLDRMTPTTAEVCDIAQAVDDYQVSLFEGAMQEMDSMAAVDFLSDLMELEALERRKLSQTINSLLDV